MPFRVTWKLDPQIGAWKSSTKTCRIADVIRFAGAANAITISRGSFSGLDVLVCATGIYDHAVRLVDIPGDRLGTAIDECFRINVGSMLLNARAAVPQLLARRGRIVLTASHASFLPAGGGVLYTAAKHAVAGIVRQLAYELAPKVRVNGVAPGMIATDMSKAVRGLAGERIKELIPMKRIGTPEDVARVVAFLASDEAGYVTGQVIRVDGGISLGGY